MKRPLACICALFLAGCSASHESGQLNSSAHSLPSIQQIFGASAPQSRIKLSGEQTTITSKLMSLHLRLMQESTSPLRDMFFASSPIVDNYDLIRSEERTGLLQHLGLTLTPAQKEPIKEYARRRCQLENLIRSGATEREVENLGRTLSRYFEEHLGEWRYAVVVGNNRNDYHRGEGRVEIRSLLFDAWKMVDQPSCDTLR